MAAANSPPDEFIQALVQLIEGWSNGPEDLGQSCGAFKDNDDIMIGHNADVVLKNLVQKLAFCGDYKVRDFAHKHEMKYTVRQSYDASKCGHNAHQTNRHRLMETTLHLNKVRKGERELTLENIEEEVSGSAFVKSSEKCPRCGETIIKTQERFIPEACDPDFLTISFNSAHMITGNVMEVAFSNSIYQIKSVLHWDPARRKAAVSVRREDGWKWYGTDVSQAEEYPFPDSLNMTHFKLTNAIVLMCVRTDGDHSSASSTDEQLADFYWSADNFNSSSEPLEGEGQRAETSDGEGAGNEVEEQQIGNEPCPSVRNQPEQEILQHGLMTENEETSMRNDGNEVEEQQTENEPCPSVRNQPEQEILQHGLMTEAEVQEEVRRLGRIATRVDQMYATADTIATSLGISLREGVRSIARGQCLWEAIEMHILNRRPGEGLPLVFQDLIQELGPEHFHHQRMREGVVDLLQDNERALPLFECTGPGGEFLSEEERVQEFRRQLAALRQNDQYAYSAADMLVDGLSLLLRLNILLFNTSTPDQLPISFHTPSRLGGDDVQARHESPLILLYDRDGSHYEEARPLDEASEARLLIVQEYFLEHGVWPVRASDAKGSEPQKKRRKLHSLEQGQLLEFSPEKGKSGRSSCKPDLSPKRQERDRSPSPEKSGQMEKPCEIPTVEASTIQSDTSQAPNGNDSGHTTSQAPNGNDSSHTKWNRYDSDIVKDFSVEEVSNFDQFRKDLTEAVADLPQLKEELKKARMGDDRITKLIIAYKKDLEGDNYKCELQTKKFGFKPPATVNLWLAQIKAKICPYLHEKYPDLDLSLLLDFEESVEHDNYHRSDPPRTKKLHKFTHDDIRQSVTSSFVSLPNPGPSREQLLMAWGALCQAIIWYAKENRCKFSDRNEAADTIDHYEDATRKVATGIKACKSMSASKRAEDELKGKSRPEGTTLAAAVKTWFESEERKCTLSMLREVSESGKVPTKSQYVRFEELLHTDMIVSGPHRGTVWKNFPYCALAEGINSPGWDPKNVAGRSEQNLETVVEEGCAFQITDDVTRPPPSLACEHQKTDPSCKCPDACLPCGYNILLTWDKGQSQQTKRNRFLHIPNSLWEEISQFCAVRDRYFQQNFKKGPSGKEPEDWFKGTCPLLLNGSGGRIKSLSMTMASRTMGLPVRGHMFRHLFCTFLARHQDEKVRAAQPQVCGQSPSIFQEYYNLNTRSDAQISMTLILNWSSASSDSVPLSNRLEAEGQKRLMEEKQRRREIEEEVKNREEHFENHSFRNPILKTQLTSLLTSVTRIDKDFIVSHPHFSDTERLVLGASRVTKEEWKKKLTRLASMDTTEGEAVRNILLQIFRGREEPTRHKWSIRETMETRLANAREKDKSEPQLEDPLWVLMDSIFVSVGTKLKNEGGKSKVDLPVADYQTCQCHENRPTFTCLHCKGDLCDRCSRCEEIKCYTFPLKHSPRFIPVLRLPRQHQVGDDRCNLAG